MAPQQAQGSGMEQPLTPFPPAPIVATVRQTVPATLPPTPPQERARGRRCCGAAARATPPRGSSGSRGGAGGTAGTSATRFPQQAQRRTDLRAAFPADAARHRPVVPDVRARRERTAQACFRRVQAGETPGFLRACRDAGAPTPAPAKRLAPARTGL